MVTEIDVMFTAGGSTKGIHSAAGIQVYAQRGVDPVLFKGTSIGALIAGYLGQATSQKSFMKYTLKLKDLFLELKQPPWAPAVRIPFMGLASSAAAFVTGRQPSVFSHYRVQRLIDQHIKVLSRPVAVELVDLLTGKPVEMWSHQVKAPGQAVEAWTQDHRPTPGFRDAILASTAIPGVFPPVWINDEFYCVDGGVTDILPPTRGIFRYVKEHWPNVTKINFYMFITHPLRLTKLNDPPKGPEILTRSLEILLHNTLLDDLKMALSLNDKPDMIKANFTVVHPKKELGGALTFSPKLMKEWWNLGYQDGCFPTRLRTLDDLYQIID